MVCLALNKNVSDRNRQESSFAKNKIMSDFSKNHKLTSSQYHQLLDNISQSQITKNNNIEFFPRGIDSYKKRWELLENAHKSIHLVSFSLMNDDTSKKLRDLLIRKLGEGVEVKLVFSDVALRTSASGYILREVVRKGGELHRYNNFLEGWVPNLTKRRPINQIVLNAKLKLKKHFHEKYFVVDGESAILGGMNWGTKYARGGEDPKAWRDSDLFLQGEVVHDIQAQFLKDFFRYRHWQETKAKNIFADYETVMRECDFRTTAYIKKEMPGYFPQIKNFSNASLRYIAHKPYDDNRLNLTNAMLASIKRANNFIYWGCHAIRPPFIVGEYLADAATRGVEVRLITNSRKSARGLMARGFLGWMYYECTRHYRWLLERGVRIFEWQNKGAFHSKNIVIDDCLAAVGSYNVAPGSTYGHTESEVFIHGGDIPRQIKQQFDIDFSSCKELLLENVLASLPRTNAFDDPLTERDFLIDPELLTETVKEKLERGYYKKIFKR